MKTRSPLALLLQGFLILILVVIGAVALVAIIGWWSGWTTLVDFKRAIQLVGLLVIAVGVVGAISKVNIFREDALAPGKRVLEDGKTNPGELIRQYSFALIMLASGVVCLLIGLLLE